MNLLNANSSWRAQDSDLFMAIFIRKAESYRNHEETGYLLWNVEMHSWYANNSGPNSGW